MNTLDERAKRAADSARRLAGTVDAEEVLGRIEEGSHRRRWLAPAALIAAGAALVAGIVAAGALLTGDTVRIDNDPSVVGTPGDAVDDRWPPAGYESEDGWIHLDPQDHGIDRPTTDVVAAGDGFLLVDVSGRVWHAVDGLSWEVRSELPFALVDLVADRGRIVALGTAEDGAELRIAWSQDEGRTWREVEDRDQLTVSAGESAWFAPRLVAGPRGFLIAAAVWAEPSDPSGGVTGPANAGATIRVLESPDGASWSVTQEWRNTGPAHLLGVAGDSEGYTLVFQGDDTESEVDKGATFAWSSGDEAWTRVDRHPGGWPVRLTRTRPAPVVGDEPAGQDLTAPGVAVHTWEFAIGEPASGQGVWFRTGDGTWERSVFDGRAAAQPGWYATAVWDGGDVLYAHVVGADPRTSAVYRSDDGYLWTELPREPVFADAQLAGHEVVAATNGRTSVFGLACCEPGVFDDDTRLELWVRRSPQPVDRDDPGSNEPTTIPTGTSDCGTVGLSGDPEPQTGLPGPVADMRVEIASAAVRCDHDLLAELARGDGTFTDSFGGPFEDLAGYFRDHVDLRLMRRLLDLPYAVDTDAEGVTYYVWPSASLEPTDEAWQALYDAGLATPEDRAEMEEAFDGWVGMRHGITAEGDWIFYVGGD